MQNRNEESKHRMGTQEDLIRLYARQKELLEYRELIERQQKEFDEYRKRTQEEQLKREISFRQELEQREKIFAEREKKLMARQRDFEDHLNQRQVETETLRDRLQREFADREAQLHAAMVNLTQEKERYNEESRKKIEKTSKDYVADALQTLANKETEFHSISKRWSVVGALGLAAAICFLSYLTFSTAITMPTIVTWEFIVFSAFKGLIVAGLLAGLAKYAFLFSRSYMQEALKNADRRHAINFGKFYLEAYGAAADWGQVKEAFEHWNIAGTNAFTQHESTSLDLTALEKAVNFFERMRSSLPKERDASRT